MIDLIRVTIPVKILHSFCSSATRTRGSIHGVAFVQELRTLIQRSLLNVRVVSEWNIASWSPFFRKGLYHGWSHLFLGFAWFYVRILFWIMKFHRLSHWCFEFLTFLYGFIKLLEVVLKILFIEAWSSFLFINDLRESFVIILCLLVPSCRLSSLFVHVDLQKRISFLTRFFHELSR